MIAADIMTENVRCITPQETISEAVELLQTLEVRHLPVVNDDDEGDGNDTADTNHRVLLRSMATDARGARRMVEVALGVE